MALFLLLIILQENNKRLSYMFLQIWFAYRKLDSVIENLAKNFAEGSDYFKVFMQSTRSKYILSGNDLLKFCTSSYIWLFWADLKYTLLDHLCYHYTVILDWLQLAMMYCWFCMFSYIDPLLNFLITGKKFLQQNCFDFLVTILLYLLDKWRETWTVGTRNRGIHTFSFILVSYITYLSSQECSFGISLFW